MRILYISRRYPPSTGGMEKLAFEVYSRISKKENVEILAWGGSNKWLFIVLPFFILKSIFILLTKKIDIIHIGDGSISPVWLILRIFKKPTAVTIHALDITFPNKLYQFLIPWCIKKIDKVICISNFTKEECLKRGLNSSKIAVVPCGISDEFYMQKRNKNELKKILENKLNVYFGNKKIVLSVGRLIKRKGFHWFIGKVIPEILNKGQDFIYILAGDGILKKQIIGIMREKNLSENVYILGRIDNETLNFLYNAADIFVMPNILIEGDSEGFGIVALEASSCCLPVIASNMEGIKDALQDYENSFLMPPSDVTAYAETIIKLLKSDEKRKKMGENSRKFIIENYNWDAISEKYLKELKSILR